MTIRTRIVLLIALTAGALLWVYGVGPHYRAVARAHREDAAGVAALKAGDAEGAENDWLAAISDWPKDADAYSNLADFYRTHGETEVAGTCYWQLLAVSPNYPHVYCRLARAAQDYGADNDARSYAKRELKQDPRCINALELLCAIDRHTGDLRSARAEGEKAYKLAPTNEEAVCRYAETFMDADPDRAIQLLSKAQTRLPNSAQIAYDLGWCYARSGTDAVSAGRAIDELQRASRLSPHGTGIRTELCRVFLEQGRVAEAAAEGKLAIATDPYDPQAYFHYSQSLRRLGREAEATQMRDKFVVLDAARSRQAALDRRYGASPGDPEIAHELVGIDVSLGHLHDAVVVMEIALYAHPRDERVLKDFRHLMELGASP